MNKQQRSSLEKSGQRNESEIAKPGTDDPQKPLPLERQHPKQFELAQLAAALASAPKAPKGPLELVADAMRLWEASGDALSLKERVDAIAQDLLAFDEPAWSDHCGRLISILDDSYDLLEGSNHEDWREHAVRSTYRASRIVQRGWARYYWTSLGADGVLEQLFRGKNETRASRKQKVNQLIDYIRNHAQESDTRASDNSSGWTMDGMERSMLETWFPMHFYDDEEYHDDLNAAWDQLRSPGDSLEKVFRFAPVVRWLAVVRKKQLSQNMVRPKKA